MAQMIEMNWSPDKSTLRNFGLIAVAGFAFVALIAHYEWLIFAMGLGSAKPYVVNTFIGLAAYSGVMGLVFPAAVKPVYVGLAILSYPIGFVLSYVIMGTLYFLIITPTGLVMRAIGHDPLDRKWDADAESYWHDSRPPRPNEHYFKQF